MSKLSNRPQKINETSWYYEERGGLTIVQEVRKLNGDYVTTVMTRVPWAKIRKSLGRKDAA